MTQKGCEACAIESPVHMTKYRSHKYLVSHLSAGDLCFNLKSNTGVVGSRIIVGLERSYQPISAITNIQN